MGLAECDNGVNESIPEFAELVEHDDNTDESVPEFAELVECNDDDESVPVWMTIRMMHSRMLLRRIMSRCHRQEHSRSPGMQ